MVDRMVLSSALLSLIHILDGVYMGVKNRYTPAGIETELLPHIPDSLFAHIRDAAEHLKEIL